jgi:hypothetical protein
MKRIISLLLILLSLLIWVQTIEATITASPSSTTIPRGLQTTESITYNITDNSGSVCTQATSTSGQFISGANILGTLSTTISATLIGTPSPSGTITETLVIPIRVIKKAEQIGVNRFQYRRSFAFSNCQQTPPPSETINIQITVTTEAGAEFRITRLQLYFENRRAEITIKKNQPSLRAYADIRFTGSGLLQGYWEVDGRRLTNVYRHLLYGRSVTIETPDIPPLPTFETGTHRVKFVITAPSQSIPFPEAIYFVTAEEFEEILPINLIFPQDKSDVEYSTITFSWEGKDRAVTYLIEFLERKDEKPIFSAFTRNSEYSLPLIVLKNIFAPRKTYLWRVKGFDTDNNKTAESSLYKFTFVELVSYLPGQIVVVTESSPKSMKLLEGLRQRYNLRLVEDFDIKSLRLKVAIFHTEEEIFRLINAITREEGVILTQPNYIFRTMSEPMSDIQNIYKILNFKKLHKHYKGKGTVVAVIDTGVDIEHKDLKDRILVSKNLFKTYPYRAEIHGTAVAGVIGASINGFGIEGVAPEAKLLALRACRQVSETYPEGECYTTSIAKALDIAIGKKTKIVNMSFGATLPDKLLVRLIEDGVKKGVIFVAPVGNMPRQKDLTFPASHPDVIAVGGTDDNGRLYPNADIASKAQVCAPATNVFTTIPGNKHNFLSGTSLSSAAVTGILAVAAGKDSSIAKRNLPRFKGDICRWSEELLKISICEE